MSRRQISSPTPLLMAKAWARLNFASDDPTGPVTHNTLPLRSRKENATSWSRNHRSAASDIWPSEPTTTSRFSPFEMSDGHAAVKALSWEEVDGIAGRFAKLNPYTDKSRSILKVERDNYDPETGKERQIYCLAISAKRYALFLRDEAGNPVLLQKGINNHEDRWSEHGLGHLRNPVNPESEDRDWIRHA